MAMPSDSDVATQENKGKRAPARPRVVRLGQLGQESVEWLWPGWIPLGKVSILDGDPGLGKSTLLLDLAARVSRGEPMPGTVSGVMGSVTILTAEDGLADTVLPRLVTAGAVLSRIQALQEVTDRDGVSRPPVIPGDVATLEEVIRTNSTRLVIIDPFMAYLDRHVEAASDQDIRRCLHRLAEVASRTGCAMVLLRHLNKQGGGKAIYRGGGSIGIIGAARSGMLVACDPDNEAWMVLASIKSNLGRRPTSLRFRLEPTPGGACRIDWGETSALTADDLLSLRVPEEEKTAVARAAEFLLEFLKKGPQPADLCHIEGQAKGMSVSTLRRAKVRLGIIHKQERNSTGIYEGGQWELPSPTAP